MDTATGSSIAIAALGIVAAMIAMHRHAINVVIPREINRLIAAIDQHGIDAKRRADANRKRIKKLAAREEKFDRAFEKRLAAFEERLAALPAQKQSTRPRKI